MGVGRGGGSGGGDANAWMPSESGPSGGGGGSSAAAVAGVRGGFPLATWRVISCAPSPRPAGRRAVVHTCLGRHLYVVWAHGTPGAPASVDAFRKKTPAVVRLERGASDLRRASPAEAAAVGAPDPDCLLLVRGVEHRTAPGGPALSSAVTLLLEAPSADVVDAWAGAGAVLLTPWPSLLSSGTGGGSDSEAVRAALRSVVPPLPPYGKNLLDIQLFWPRDPGKSRIRWP